MSISKKHSLLVVICSILSADVLGQAASPFSTFGIGEHYGNAMVHHQGMGGVGIGAPQTWFINSQNPALLAYNRLTIFEAGIVGESKTISGTETSQRATGGNLNYLAMAFPVRPKDLLKPHRWTTSVGLSPYTNVNYLLQYTGAIEGSDNTTLIEEEGSGGLTQVYWSNGYRVTKNIAFGLQAAYLFGSIDNEYSNQLNETSQPIPYIVKISERTYVRDFTFTAGVSFVKDSLMGGDYMLCGGAIYAFGSDLNAERKVKFSRTSLLDNVLDSLTLSSRNGSLFIPQEIGLGVSLSKGLKWTVAADVRYRDWAEFQSLDDEDEEGLGESWKVALGAELTPDTYAVDGLFKKMTYRAGVSMEQMPFLANNKQVKDFGINFGLSIPAGRSSLDVACKIGKRGNKSENVLEESYFRVYFGLTLNDQWFIKRKFD